MDYSQNKEKKASEKEPFQISFLKSGDIEMHWSNVVSKRIPFTWLERSVENKYETHTYLNVLTVETMPLNGAAL